MKKIIITGATSFLGRNVIGELSKDDYLIYALCRKNSPSLNLLKENKKVHIVYGSLSNMKTVLASQIDTADIFIHFAWDGSGRQGRADENTQRKNAAYAIEALEIANQLGCSKFIFPGSQAEYGVRHDVIRETDICHPVSAYGKAKLLFQEMAEQRADLSHIALLHLRIFSIYGFGDRSGTLVDSCIDTFNSENSIELSSCQQFWNFLYINDFVKILSIFIQEEIPSGIYNIASDDTRVLSAFVDEIWALSNKRGQYFYGNDQFNPEGVPNLRPDITAMMNILGSFSFTKFEQGIDEIMNCKGL